MKPTLALLAALLLAPLAALSAAAAATDNRPNILWILVDDIGLDLGCYGRKEVHTPNLDRLASEGARYTRAFTPASVCSPCRSSFITGLYPNQVFSHNMRIYAPLVKHALPNGVECFTKYIRDAGYAVGMPSKYQKTDWGFETPKAPAFDIKNWDELIKKEPFFASINSRRHIGHFFLARNTPSIARKCSWLRLRPICRRFVKSSGLIWSMSTCWICRWES